MLPIVLREYLNLENVGICQGSINFNSINMEGDRYVCIQEKKDEIRQLAIADLQDTMQISRPMICAESISLNSEGNIVILKDKVESNTAHKKLQIIDLKTKNQIKHFISEEDVIFWKWISQNVIAFLTDNSLYHWSVEGDSAPVKMFNRHLSLKGNQVINYRTDHSQNWLLLIGISFQNNRVVGTMQLHCLHLARSQIILAHAACFTTLKMEGNQSPTNLICFATRQEHNSKLYIVEVGQTPTGNLPFPKISVDITFHSEHDDFPVAMQASSMYDILFMITKFGYLYLFEIETGNCICVHKIVSEGTVFVSAPQKSTGGIIAISSRGNVISASIDEKNIIGYLRNTLGNQILAFKLALKHNLSGADDLFLEKFKQFLANGKFLEAAKIAANAPNGLLRTLQVMQLFQNSNSPPGEKPPLLIYFETLLKNGKLNSLESIALCKPVIAQNRINLLQKWIEDDKLEYSEQLGDLVKPMNSLLALSIYIRASIPNKVIQCFLETKDYHKIVLYSQKIGYNPDYLTLLKTIMWSDLEQAVMFAKMLASSNLSVDVNKIVESFLEHNHVQECTNFLLDYLKKNRPEDSSLQTRLLEINISYAPAEANSILQKQILTHYDRGRIAMLCEKAGLLERALENYSELNDIKRILVDSQSLNPGWLVNFFNKLSADDTIDCLDAMLSANMKQNMQACIQISITYCEKLTTGAIINLFEKHKSFEGVFSFLASVIAFNTDEEVHFKYLEAACKTNQFKDLERICRESNFYNGRDVFEYLKKVRLSDQIPLIIVCDRFNFVNELITYLYQNNLQKYIEIYVQKFNTSRLPVVVGVLLDLGCQEDVLKRFIGTVPCQYSTVELIKEVENRNQIKLLLPWLEQQVENGSEDIHVFNALAKIYIDINKNVERFLKENKFYDSLAVGKYCEKRNPYYAFIAYERGQCDYEVIKVCEEESLFKLEARYLIQRNDSKLWARVLNEENPCRKSLIDQVVQTILETKNSDEITNTVKAFIAAEVSHELLELLERLIFDNCSFSTNSNLQNLLIMTAIKSDKTRVMEYINRLNAFDSSMISNVAIKYGLHQEVFTIYTKINDNSNAILVLLNYSDDIERAYNFAERCDEPSVWSHLAEAQLQKGMIKEALQSFMKAGDPSKYKDVIEQASKSNYLEELTNYLIMARKKISDPRVDNELLYLYASSKKYSMIEDSLSESNDANLLELGERCYKNSMFEAAKIFFQKCLNFAALASTCVCLNEFEEAVTNARKANKTKTWKEVCFACIADKNFRLSQICALNVITCVDELNDVVDIYKRDGYFNELIILLESALSLEGAHMGIFTELAILYSHFDIAKLKEHLELFWSRMNISKVLKAAMEAHLWSELVFLYDKCEEYDNAISIMIEHPTEAWKECYFKEMIPKVRNIELYYSAITFYLAYKPLLLNEMLLILSPRIDHTRCINYFSKVRHLKFIQPYLISEQSLNNRAINETLNHLYIEEENYHQLKVSIDTYDNFDIIALAQALEKHDLVEFRRIAAYLYKKNNRWHKSINLCKDHGLYRDAIEYASDSKSTELVEDLVIHFLEKKKLNFFVATLVRCYDLLRPDVILELSWRYNALNSAMPYFVQVMYEYISKINTLIEVKNHT